jgi:hypothetical protein
VRQGEQDEAARARALCDKLFWAVGEIGRIDSVIGRISEYYSRCEKRIEDRYDSLWHYEKDFRVSSLDISAVGENMNDIVMS